MFICATKIIAGWCHTLALANDGKVYDAGSNEYGQLGLGHTTNQKRFAEITFLRNINIREIIAGWSHTLALANDGRVYGAGDNKYGQLGLGHTTDQNTFVEITSLRNINIREIIGGVSHTLALANDGKVYDAGCYQYDQPGLEHTKYQKIFVEITSLRNINIREIIGGGIHTLALANDGKVYGAGYNKYGQLGLGHTTDQNTFVEITSLRNINIREIIAGGSHTLAIANNGTVYGAGDNAYGQLGLGGSSRRVLGFTPIPNIKVTYPSSLGEKLAKKRNRRERIDMKIKTLL